MTVIERTKPARAVCRRGASAAAIAAVLAVLGLIAGCSGDNAEPAAAEPTPTTAEATPTTVAPTTAAFATAEEVAMQFLEAYAAFDVDRAAAYLTADGLEAFGGSVESMRLVARFREAEGFKRLFGSCEGHAASPPATRVRCVYDMHAIRSDEMGLGPFGDNYYDLTVVDGMITAVSNHFAYMTNGFSDQVWEPFADWVATEYPEDAAVMYTDGSQTMYSLSEESFALWEQRSREYADLMA